jgi:hypothetical protein
MNYPGGWRWTGPDESKDVYFEWREQGQAFDAVRRDQEAGNFLLWLVRTNDVTEIVITRGDVRIKVIKETTV